MATSLIHNYVRLLKYCLLFQLLTIRTVFIDLIKQYHTKRRDQAATTKRDADARIQRGAGSSQKQASSPGSSQQTVNSYESAERLPEESDTEEVESSSGSHKKYKVVSKHSSSLNLNHSPLNRDEITVSEDDDEEDDLLQHAKKRRPHFKTSSSSSVAAPTTSNRKKARSSTGPRWSSETPEFNDGEETHRPRVTKEQYIDNNRERMLREFQKNQV